MLRTAAHVSSSFDWLIRERQRLCSQTIESVEEVEAAIGIEPMNKGFADLCLTTWLRRHLEG
jgi:hypothetical protein